MRVHVCGSVADALEKRAFPRSRLESLAKAARELADQLGGRVIPRAPAACAFRQAPLGPAVRAQNQEVVPRAPRSNARLTNPQIAGARGIAWRPANTPCSKPPRLSRRQLAGRSAAR
jgi:hypothetical protein